MRAARRRRLPAESNAARGTPAPLLLVLTILSGPAIAEPLLLDVVSTDVYRDDVLDAPYLALRLSLASAEDFGAFTGRRVGCLVDLRINGRLVMTANIVEPITLGSFSVYSYDDDVHALSALIMKSKACTSRSRKPSHPGLARASAAR